MNYNAYLAEAITLSWKTVLIQSLQKFSDFGNGFFGTTLLKVTVVTDL